MKKILYILVIFIVLPVSGQINLGNKGGSFLSKNGVFLSYTIPSEPEEPEPYTQIIANHSVVDLYDDIPQQWIDSVKKMFVTVAGQSHAEGYFTGVQMLEELDATYAVSVVSSGTPESYTTSNLRMSGAMWGNLENATGWIYGYDTWDWAGGTPYDYTYSQSQAERVMAGISYAHNNGLTKAAMAYGYCYNEGYWESYITATQALVDYCEAQGLPTKVFFTTGPADGHLAAATEEAYTESLRWTAIRNHVLADSTLILFDYNDILSYNDAGQQQTNTWNGHTFPVIHTENTTGDITCFPCASGHIGGNGCLKLGKAMWWMLARIAGWDGTIEGEIDSTLTDIVTFSLARQVGIATINPTNHTVSVVVDYVADITNLIPTITLSDGATISPPSGTARNFAIPQTYTVTALDGTTTQVWTVIVTQEEEPLGPISDSNIVKYRGLIFKL